MGKKQRKGKAKDKGQGKGTFRKGREKDPELPGVISLLFLIRHLQEKGGGGGSAASRSDFLTVFNI